MCRNAIELRGVTKRFSDFTLGPIDLAIPKGSIVGYIGQNGAGKSTTLKRILGLLTADAGEITVLGEKNPKDAYVKDRLGVVFDDLHVPEELTVTDIEAFCRRVYMAWDREKFMDHIARFALPKKKAVKDFSRGMRMKLSLAIALSHGAELLLLDEATSGLDPIVRDEILEELMDFMQDEMHTILMSSHITSDLEKVADYIAFIDHGKLLFFSPKDELVETYGLVSLSNEEMAALDPRAVVGMRTHAFGKEALVVRNLVPSDLRVEKPSIEDIMIYLSKGGAK